MAKMLNPCATRWKYPAQPQDTIKAQGRMGRIDADAHFLGNSQGESAALSGFRPSLRTENGKAEAE
jgi:hypothetical protein